MLCGGVVYDGMDEGVGGMNDFMLCWSFGNRLTDRYLYFLSSFHN